MILGTATVEFCVFFSPGTFVAERSERVVLSRDVKAAYRIAGSIKERHGAAPYGFRFESWLCTVPCDAVPESKKLRMLATSPMHYIGGKVETVEQVRERAPGSILLSNMENNDYQRVVTTANGYLWTQPLDDGDVVLDENGDVVS